MSKDSERRNENTQRDEDIERQPDTDQDERAREQRREHDTNEKVANDALDDAHLLPLPEATPTSGPAPAP